MVMKPFALLAAGLMLAATVTTAAPARPQPVPGEPVEKLPPFNVREQVFPSIEVHFELSGLNLADSLADPILEAKITAVDDDGMGARLGLHVGDTLTALNGIPLRGLNIRQIAAIVAQARHDKADLVWDGRHGLTAFTVRYNGKWDTPLPGQAR
jgi:membrane-associated protease RseP (regulator of RpoE activity)